MDVAVFEAGVVFCQFTNFIGHLDMIHLKNCKYLVAWTNFMVSADKWPFSGVIHLIVLNWMDEVRLILP